ncbi:ABC transporter ATP-binding protein [Spirilliplanes yamanashiensis]|uniref:Multidrug ABC transporter ATP-binding protein n=1 Tax=Spirilliplanes yamanashiensis TaxID=42233 RepID=A0A8J3Y9W1_9ACTN|nr:ABC transporter ATP-binding protein [Spirilliplanes yamanashiensis]MDP9815933.1 ABC-type multidrug transport system fused ATPase/permease subunit [Spirilliplanes yamanashiensis]GIJ04189.1 multidrug ABC transporter ATP-binding protein [Spirilliplanes yamanashiensis]
MSTPLPVADAAMVRRYARTLLRRHPRALGGALALHAVAAATGLVAPRLLGGLVESIERGRAGATIDRVALLIVGFVLVQSVLTRFARLASATLGERVLAELREDFVDRVLAIPLSTVERAGTGDLVTRTSRDVDALSHSVRRAVPETLIAIVTGGFVVGALLLVDPLLALPCLVAVPLLWGGTRWYLRRAPAGYLRENAAWAKVTDGLQETVDGARTVDVLRRARHRVTRSDADLTGAAAAEKYTLRLRTVWFPIVEIGYVVPVAATLLVGGWFHLNGMVTLGAVTAATLYVQQLIDPVDRLLNWLDELQVGAASLARLLGIGRTGEPERAATAEPAGRELVAAGVRFAYQPGRDVLRGIDLTIRPGERLAIVGPSGAGKSTLGRLLAGVHAPTAGAVTVGGVPLAGLPLDRLRREVALVSQEHHVFLGTLRDNVAMVRPGASDADVTAALAAVGWSADLPDGLDTEVGARGVDLTAAQAQQLALARLVLADPHTLVLDEATSLIDPRAARDLERSLAAVLRGRTVVAIAHRLFSAHDADRVAVVEDGRVIELGTHDELVAAGGSYASLWRSWHGAGVSAS